MSFIVLANHMPKELKNELVGKDPSTWVDVLQGKNDQLATLFKLIMTQAQNEWQLRDPMKSLTQKTAQVLQTKNQANELSGKAKKDFDEAQAIFSRAVVPAAPVPEQQSSVPLYTSKITKKENCQALKKVITAWKKKATRKNDKAKSMPLSFDQKERVDDSRHIISLLKDDLPKKVKKGKKSKRPQGKEEIYVAYDASNKIQAIALKDVKKNGKQYLWLIGSNPDNVPLVGNEKVVKGAGTAIIKHIVQEILQMKERRTLHLDSLESSLPFYEKLGFVRGKADGYGLIKMTLPVEKMDEFLHKYGSVGTMVATEPSAKALKASI